MIENENENENENESECESESIAASETTLPIQERFVSVQGEGALVRELRLVHGDYENRTVKLVMPAEPGFYQPLFERADNDLFICDAGEACGAWLTLDSHWT